LDQGRGTSLNLVTTTQNVFVSATKIKGALQHMTGSYKISFLSIGIGTILALYILWTVPSTIQDGLIGAVAQRLFCQTCSVLIMTLHYLAGQTNKMKNYAMNQCLLCRETTCVMTWQIRSILPPTPFVNSRETTG
jgi:hypothetical protein